MGISSKERSSLTKSRLRKQRKLLLSILPNTNRLKAMYPELRNVLMLENKLLPRIGPGLVLHLLHPCKWKKPTRSTQLKLCPMDLKYRNLTNELNSIKFSSS